MQEKSLQGGFTLMTHGKSDVMEARPRIDPSVNVCVACAGWDNEDRAIERLIRLRGWETGYCEFNR